MNGRFAKDIRKMVREHSGLPAENKYNTKEFKRLVGGVVETRKTVTLDKGCQRGLYEHLKKVAKYL